MAKLQGRKNPGDLVGNRVQVCGVVKDGEETEELATERIKRAAAELGSRGGKARAARITPERRTEIARAVAAKRRNKPTRAE
jgi:hypothetical protein